MEKFLELLRSLLTEDFLMFSLALTLLMAANVLTGIMKAVKSGTFDWEILLDGILRYTLWLFGCAFGVAGAQVYGGELSITVGEETLTLLEAIEFAKKAVYIFWAAKFIANFLEYGKIETTAKERIEARKFNSNMAIEPEQTTFNTVSTDEEE